MSALGWALREAKTALVVVPFLWGETLECLFVKGLVWLSPLLRVKTNEEQPTVSHQTHVLRQLTFFFSSLFSAINVDLPRSCLVRTGVP